ncbi:MAG: hypothetical protein IJP91_01100 [Synergistaceae bacterium]|nr:hypothetical protein [Synergistaceae bacterium]
MIVLRHGKFISGSRIFRAGEILPDNAGVQELVGKGMAEVVETVKKSKAAKKSEPDKAEPTQENAKGDS